MRFNVVSVGGVVRPECGVSVCVLIVGLSVVSLVGWLWQGMTVCVCSDDDGVCACGCSVFCSSSSVSCGWWSVVGWLFGWWVLVVYEQLVVVTARFSERERRPAGRVTVCRCARCGSLTV